MKTARGRSSTSLHENNKNPYPRTAKVWQRQIIQNSQQSDHFLELYMVKCHDIVQEWLAKHHRHYGTASSDRVHCCERKGSSIQHAPNACSCVLHRRSGMSTGWGSSVNSGWKATQSWLLCGVRGAITSTGGWNALAVGTFRAIKEAVVDQHWGTCGVTAHLEQPRVPLE